MRHICLYLISIHALREESDTTISRYILLCSKFQSTLSARRATGESSLAVLVEYKFQSTLSARRATIFSASFDNQSIYFNPRSPRGERQQLSNRFTITEQFQSTLSARRATPINNPKTDNSKNFNPRSPRGERLNEIFDGDTTYIISIHALREESDCLV